MIVFFGSPGRVQRLVNSLFWSIKHVVCYYIIPGDAQPGRRSARNNGQADMHPCCSHTPFIDVVKCSGHDSKSKPFNPALGKGHNHGGMPYENNSIKSYVVAIFMNLFETAYLYITVLFERFYVVNFFCFFVFFFFFFCFFFLFFFETWTCKLIEPCFKTKREHCVPDLNTNWTNITLRVGKHLRLSCNTW